MSHGSNQSGIGSGCTFKRLSECQLAGASLPGSRTGHAGYPQAQCAVLVECASHAIIAANLGAYGQAEWAICKPLLACLKTGMLCLADRCFNGYTHWAAARETGAQLFRSFD